MPLTIPTIEQTIANAMGDLESRIDGADAHLPVSSMQAVAMAKAAADDDFYAYLDNRSKQLFPKSATYNLVALAAQKGIFRKAAQAAVLTLAVAGTNGTVGVGAFLTRGDGTQYQVNAGATLQGGAGSITVQSMLPASAANCANGTQLTFSSPPNGIASIATVTATMQSGSDQETLDALRGRLIARWQQPPQGGAYYDYTAWTLAVPGVTRAWPYPLWMGPGTIGITFVLDNNPVSIIPQAGDLANVVAAIGAWGADGGPRPVTARPYVFAPTATPLNPQIRISPNNATIQALVSQQLADLIAREAQPGGSLVQGSAYPYFFWSHLEEAIGATAGLIDFSLTSPAANVPLSGAQLLTLGAPVFSGP